MNNYCKNCGKELVGQKKRNQYCSQECCVENKKRGIIDKWKNGDISGAYRNNILSKAVRNYLLRKSNYKCENCGWGEKNLVTNLYPLEIHHIDGNYFNNTETNLRVLCPNCHSLTPNYKSLNRIPVAKDRRKSYSRKWTEEYFCVDCGRSISYKASRCRECSNKRKIQEVPISRDRLKRMIREIPFEEIGRVYGVSGNAIKKWCIKYCLPKTKREIISFSDEEYEKI